MGGGGSISSLVTVHWPFSFLHDLDDHPQISLPFDVRCRINPVTILDEIRQSRPLWKTNPVAILMNHPDTFVGGLHSTTRNPTY